MYVTNVNLYDLGMGCMLSIMLSIGYVATDDDDDDTMLRWVTARVVSNQKH